MKILLISWYFPPVNDVAALRTGAIADYLQRRGHEVFVLTAARRGGDESLPVPLPLKKIVRTSWFDIDQLRVHAAADTSEKRHGERAQRGPSERSRRFVQLRAIVTKIYTDFLHIPDRQVGWLPYARRAGRALIQSQGIDLIYASGPSFTSFMTARALGRQFRIPWIAEYRDGWSGDVYRPRAKWRELVDRLLENRTVRSAAGVVAVSAPWAEFFRSRFGKPTAAIYNGFDVGLDPPVVDETLAPDEPVSIAYFGELYDGLRNPSQLYAAIRKTGFTPGDVRIDYYGPSEDDVLPLAEAMGVSEYVSVQRRVAYAESLHIQRCSDILLLLQAPGDPRNVPAKLFEYFASGRPIIGLGLDDGVPARMIRERSAGLYITDPDAVARQLVEWVAEKRRTGRIADVPKSARAGLSRLEQLGELEKFLVDTKTRAQENF